ncbi:hypothetical protein [Photobacterium leiognathi]|uniref:hypothetical protein n=1 Tax=Photobacterium leiognathi TaxID=553611 RepID=UPI002980DC9C|nr:hypothetical protein [Photobacterium leiognathi]
MKDKKKFLFILLFFFSCNVIAGLGSRTGEVTINPSVKIVKENGASGIEIVPDKKVYTTIYDVSSASFLPLSMGFNVVSTKKTDIEYTLSLNVQNYCREEGTKDDKKMTGVEYQLDGKAVTPSIITNEITKGPFKTNSEKWHQLKYKFPILQQDNTFKTCYGFIGITAQLSNSY